MRWRPAIPLALGGAAIGAIAWGAEVWGGLRPPHAYGLCTTCHGADLVGWLANRALAVGWQVSSAGAQAPLLTSVGLLLGGWAAARLGREIHTAPARHLLLSFLAGVVSSNLGLLALGCPVRQLLLAAYGDWIALPALTGHVLGVWLGTGFLRWRAERMP